MCDDIAHEEAFWIGEYRGHDLSFEMTINGTRFDPPRETKTLTLFEMNGRLGFDGGGAFKGSGFRDVAQWRRGTSDPPGFKFLFDKPIRGVLSEFEDEYCTFEF
ncbi:hypothetical protein [Thalassospira alkalitolerans]|uniref:hypothetical protein n=1 Tax=Thalassospira alkalitolerans TaxID=1293890 RepID=UPI003AA8C5F2